MRLKNRKIVLGVTGSIAAYKALDVTRRLKKEGAEVWVVMTKNAQEFVSPLSFQTIAAHPVAVGSFEPCLDPLRHINLAEDCDLVAIVPATANIISKSASGIADDLLTTILLATKKPRVLAPAMHEHMWQNPIIKENVSRLQKLGFTVIEPERGELASGTIGEGRLASVETIVARISSLLTTKRSMTGTAVIVTAGRTEEPVDPIRVITNRSSGRMGFELAQAFNNRGAEVTLVTGKTGLQPPAGMKIERVSTSHEMLQAVTKHLPKARILVMAAAVSDFRPAAPAATKTKAKTVHLKLQRTEDILTRVAKSTTNKIIVGFSLETEDGIARALKKLQRKHLNLVIANPLASLESDTSQATLVFQDRTVKELPLMTKQALAEVIVTEVEKLVGNNG